MEAQILGALIQGRGKYGTNKAFNLRYLHVLHAGMVYIPLWYVCVPRYVLGQYLGMCTYV